MKVAYISDSVIPSASASSIHVMKMCSALGKTDLDVTLYAPNKPSEEVGASDIYSFYDVERSFELRKLGCLSFAGRLASNAAYGIQSYREVKASNPDFVYGRFLPSCWLLARKGIPTIFEAHTLPRYQRPGFLVDTVFKCWCQAKGNRATTTISQALKLRLEDEYQIHNILVLPDAAEIVHPDAVQPRCPPNDLLQVGYLGGLYSGRGIELIIDLAKRCTWAQFHVIGGSEEAVAQYVRLYEPSSNLTFHGHVPPKETEPFRQMCDVLLAPYQESLEVFGGGNSTADWMSPLKIFEYMASGKSIIASDLPALREILTHRKNALLCEPTNIEEWEQHLSLLRDQPELRTTLGQHATNDHESNYTWNTRAKNIAGLMRKCLYN